MWRFCFRCLAWPMAKTARSSLFQADAGAVRGAPGVLARRWAGQAGDEGRLRRRRNYPRSPMRRFRPLSVEAEP